MITKIRTTDSTPQGDAAWGRTNADSLSAVITYVPKDTYGACNSVESIDYTAFKPKSMNYCVHDRVRRERNSVPVTGLVYEFDPPTGYRLIEQVAVGLGYLWTSTASDVQTAGMSGLHFPFPSPPMDDPDAESYGSEALRAMWPKVEADVSSLNFLWELREINRSIPQVIASLGRLDSVIRRLPKRRRGALSRVLRSLIKEGSTAVLIKNYGHDTLVRDLQNLYSAAQAGASEARRLLDTEKRILKSHWSCDLAGLDDQSYGPVGTALWERMHVSYERRRFTATMHYSFVIPDEQRRQLVWLSSLDKFGVNINPSTIWDAIPYSFVIDWYFGVGRLLDQFTIRNVRPAVNIRQWCHSTHVIRRISRSISIGRNAASEETGKETIIAEDYRDKYVRVPGRPPPFDFVLRQGRISNREIILGGALFGSHL